LTKEPTFGDGLLGDDKPLTDDGADGGLDGRSMYKLYNKQVRLKHKSQPFTNVTQNYTVVQKMSHFLLLP